MMLLALLLPFLALAANEPQEIWSLKVEGGKPEAAFFDAGTGSLFVSVKEDGGRARLDRVSLDGAMIEKGEFRSKGEAGALRAYGGKLFWTTGTSVRVLDPKEGSDLPLRYYPEEAKGKATDISVGRDGSVYLAFPDALFRVGGAGSSRIPLDGKGEVGGLFILNDTLHLIRGTQLLSRAAEKDGSWKKEKFCDCRWLERTSSGAWMSTSKGEILLDGKALLTLKTEIGRPAYVFRMNTAEDFFVLPLKEERKIVAYRMPGEEKAKKNR